MSCSLLFVNGQRMSRIFWLCALFGAALEVAQGLLTAGRTASGWDAFANSFGAALGVLVAIGVFARLEIGIVPLKNREAYRWTNNRWTK